MRLYHTNEVSKILQLSQETIKYRTRCLEIKRQKIKRQRGYFYTDEQIDLLNNFSRKSRQCLVKNLYKNNKIEIVEYFKANKSNETKVIAEKLNIRIAIVEKALSEYLKDRIVIVESKMNK